MLDCWYLSTNNRLIFMEDLESRKITFVNLMTDATTQTKTFVLPGDVRMAKRLTHNLEALVRKQ